MTFSLAGTHNKAYFAHFGETVTWQPFGRTERSIKAVVDRNPPAPLSAVPQSLSAGLVIVVRNAETSIDDDDCGGIGSDELMNDGMARGRLEVAVRVGTTATARVIRRIVAQDEGLLTLEVG